MSTAALLRVLLCAVGCLALAACSRPDPVVIASANTTEQNILAEIIARRLEVPGIPVERARPYPSVATAHQAVLAHAADIAVEYTGAAWLALLHHEKPNDMTRLQKRVRAEYASLQLKWFDSLGFASTFTLAVRSADAGRLRLRTITDAERSPDWALAVTPEFLMRADGFRMLMVNYPGLHWARPPERTDPQILYQALAAGRANMVAGNTTDGALEGSDFCGLNDDRHALPSEDAAIVARFDTLSAHPQIEAALAALSGTVSHETMWHMNAEVDMRQRNARAVAAEFLAGVRK